MAGAILLYLAAANLAAFAAFAADKRAAVRGDWRIRERTLLTLAAAGGGPGAVLAQTTLRHKKRKEPFRTQLYIIVILELTAISAILLLL